MYPNNGEFFGEPADQKDKRTKDENQIANLMPLISDMVKRFKERITFYSTNEGITDEVLTSPEEFMHVVASNKLVVDALISEKEYLEGLIKDFMKL